MKTVSAVQLSGEFEAILLDAYGVLVDAGGAIEGADAFLRLLEAQGRPYLVVSNDTSKLPETAARIFSERGVPVDADRILTSGMLLKGWFAGHELESASCLVLGPEDTKSYVRLAGGVVEDTDTPDVLVVGDEAGFSMLEAMDRALTAIIRGYETGSPPKLVCPNPDIIYPKGNMAYGFAAGSLARMLEEGATRRLGIDVRCERLGKPEPWLFEEAVERLGTREVVMLGDQLATDIAGAHAANLKAALVSWGLTAEIPSDFVPRQAAGLLG